MSQTLGPTSRVICVQEETRPEYLKRVEVAEAQCGDIASQY